MSDRGTVSINGQKYDAVSGLPLPVKQSPVAAKPAAPATSSPVTKRVVERVSQVSNPHARVQRSTTLNRKFTAKPVPASKTIARHHPSRTLHQDIKPASRSTTRSTVVNPSVRKFAPHPIGATKSMDIGPSVHPHVAKAHALSAAKEAHRESAHLTQHVSAAEIKKETVSKAVHEATAPSAKQQKQRLTGIISATFALVLLGSYFTYLNMPNLSVRVAAAQAGIDASYPNYRPDGYALNGPVTYSDGRVSMNFKSNGGNSSFTVNQSKSSWNSDAVLDNYVTPKAGDSYMPYTERGLTIFTYDNSAAWVNGGILYTIEGDAPLSGDQIRQIATSLL